MSESSAQKEWRSWCADELDAIRPLLAKLGYTLDEEQKHIGGERFLMQAVTTASGKKLILTGTRTRDDTHVIIKATSDPAGAREIEHERESRQTLHAINFAYQTFFSPKEYLFTRRGDFLIAIYEYIEQECPFLERPTPEQFSYALTAFKAQESAHATTYSHIRTITRVFESADAARYRALYEEFSKNIHEHLPEEHDVAAHLAEGRDFLAQNTETIERYGSFLTHTDFVPHNFRIRDGKIYLLDHSSLRFGNKYEGWARFVNFMTLYNPELAEALLQYVRDNRTPEEYLALRLMRVYRLSEIIWYYTQTLEKTTGDLHTLNQKRIDLWSTVLKSVLADQPLDEAYRQEYIQMRDQLRSPEEKKRQENLH